MTYKSRILAATTSRFQAVRDQVQEDLVSEDDEMMWLSDLSRRIRALAERLIFIRIRPVISECRRRHALKHHQMLTMRLANLLRQVAANVELRAAREALDALRTEHGHESTLPRRSPALENIGQAEARLRQVCRHDLVFGHRSVDDGLPAWRCALCSHDLGLRSQLSFEVKPKEMWPTTVRFETMSFDAVLDEFAERCCGFVEDLF
ncbi:MAG: hypothetical protein PHT12_05430 [Patescibacteria group bacterium]|nr:hypothetical protein [Patescibacteria group bacterium]